MNQRAIIPKMKDWDVFISHASEDKESVVVPLAESLRRAGLKVWLDRQEIQLAPQLVQEPGPLSSGDITKSENFEAAVMQGHDPAPQLEAIRQLPLEKRYVSRVASALKWSFADRDDLSVWRPTN